MKNMLVFGSILAATAATFACGDSTGDGGSGGATTQASTSPASGSGTTATKTTATTGTGASTTANTTASSTASGSGATTTAASSGSGGACAPTGDACQDCVFMNCCNEYMACAGNAACQTCMDCLQTNGAACLANGMCDLGDPNQSAFIQCAQQCQAQCT